MYSVRRHSAVGVGLAGRIRRRPGGGTRQIPGAVSGCQSPRYPYRLNGLLFGAAVGAGFPAFESAGYALHVGLSNSNAMKNTMRGMFSPFGHIAWTAMCGAVLWRVKGARKFSFEMVKDSRFLKIFFLAVVLHIIRNTPWRLPFYGKFAVLGVAAWVVLLALIQDGPKELARGKGKGPSGRKPECSSPALKQDANRRAWALSPLPAEDSRRAGTRWGVTRPGCRGQGPGLSAQRPARLTLPCPAPAADRRRGWAR